MALTIFLGLFIFVGFLSYLYAKNVYKFWKNHGVLQLNPIFPFGDILPLMRQEKCAGDYYWDLYKRTKAERFIGIYNMIRPTLLVNDPQLVKKIMVADSEHFRDRGSYVDEKRDPLSGHLFALQGEKWKFLRAKLTPTFTSGKIKGMFPTLLASAENLEKFVQKVAMKGEVIEVRDLMARYGTDIIASVAFGYEIDSVNNPDQEFRRIGRKVFELSLINAFRFTSTLLFPQLMKSLGVKSVDNDVEKFFINLVQTNLEYREKNNVSRRDFLQLMIQLRNMGNIKLNDDWESKTVEEHAKTMTLNEVAAQAFVFYAAGFETSSTTMSFCLFELARNPDIQQKVQTELDEVLARHNGNFTYESIQEMTYLDNCVDEALRKYPPLPILQRECSKDYQIPGTDTVIPAGVLTLLPIIGIQRDEELYPEPMRFRPERFRDPAYHDTLKTAYYPFGDGPRVCIGLRMGKIMTKIGLGHLLAKFRFELAQMSGMEELELSKQALLLVPKDGINLKVSRRQ